MTPERWQKVEELFHLSLEREASQRAAFLDEACAGDPDLRGKVELLLAYDEQESDFLETPASEVSRRLARRGSTWTYDGTAYRSVPGYTRDRPRRHGGRLPGRARR